MMINQVYVKRYFIQSTVLKYGGHGSIGIPACTPHENIFPTTKAVILRHRIDQTSAPNNRTPKPKLAQKRNSTVPLESFANVVAQSVDWLPSQPARIFFGRAVSWWPNCRVFQVKAQFEDGTSRRVCCVANFPSFHSELEVRLDAGSTNCIITRGGMEDRKQFNT
jgi:hypothetical protein